MLEARAVNRYINSSPRKMRLVIDLIRGKSVPEALGILHFSPKHASRVAEKVLRSAVSNLQNKDEAGRTETDTLYIKEVFVDGGPGMKRMMPAPMGRAYRIVKRSNHLTIVVAQRVEKVKKVQAVKPKEKHTTKKPTQE
ncbi:MAG: 50S ribosomal protein L22 [Ignavibacteria bacterium]|nr:50S ribosomal protein L22 [Ignavibacteria bacterium]MBI3765920.1 50S ribosomal protein L22 [Ignavibacteriales bacterium]